MEKINISELLKDCPKGMELDCTIFDDNCVEFSDIADNEFLPIRCRIKTSNGGYNYYNFTKYGCWIDDGKAKCVIFPKGKTTWEGFHRPFKDGDVITCTNSCCTFTSIFKEGPIEKSFIRHCILILDDNEFKVGCSLSDFYNPRFATEEEKEKLFKAIKDNGYKWNAETKTLKKLETFKFALNSIVRLKGTDIHYRVVEQKMNRIMGYYVEYEYKLRNIIDNSTKMVYAVDEDDYELVPDKFDINTLVPFESRVLVRDSNKKWRPAIYGFCHKFETRCAFYVVGGCVFEQCIPFENNEHLIGKIDDCDEYFKNWK